MQATRPNPDGRCPAALQSADRMDGGSVTARLADIASIQPGYQHPGRIEPDPEGPFAIVQAKDLSETGELSTESLVRTQLKRDPRRWLVHAGDVLLLAKGTRHTAALVREPLFRTLVSGTFLILRPRDQFVRPDYLAWFLNQEPAQKYFAENSSGATIVFLPRDVVEGTQIVLPSLEVQEKAAALGELARRERALTMQLLDRREQLARGMTMRAILRSKS